MGGKKEEKTFLTIRQAEEALLLPDQYCRPQRYLCGIAEVFRGKIVTLFLLCLIPTSVFCWTDRYLNTGTSSMHVQYWSGADAVEKKWRVITETVRFHYLPVSLTKSTALLHPRIVVQYYSTHGAIAKIFLYPTNIFSRGKKTFFFSVWKRPPPLLNLLYRKGGRGGGGRGGGGGGIVAPTTFGQFRLLKGTKDNGGAQRGIVFREKGRGGRQFLALSLSVREWHDTSIGLERKISRTTYSRLVYYLIHNFKFCLSQCKMKALCAL